jgi:MFS family permease
LKPKILTRTILLVSFVSLFTDIASEMLYPIMPVYLRSIGFSVLLIGILEGVAEATAGLSKGYFGNLSDIRQKRVPFIRWGYTLSAFSKPMLAIFIFPLWIFFARTLDRFGKGIRTSARDAMLSDETTTEHKGRVFGFHRSMDTTGAAIGPVFALVFLYFYPEQYKWLFFIAFFPGIVAIMLTFLLLFQILGQILQRFQISGLRPTSLHPLQQLRRFPLACLKKPGNVGHTYDRPLHLL